MVPGEQTGPDAASLMEAFSLFNQASKELTEAYGALQQEVERLSAELADANTRLREELAAKERMRERLAMLLEMLPGAVLVVDHVSVIMEMNLEARRILGADLRGADWRGVQALHSQSGPHEWVLQGATGAAGLRVTVAVNALPGEGGQIILLQDVTSARVLEEAAQRRERLAAMGETMAGLAHQLRTPLSTTLLSVSQMTYGRGEERFHKQQQRAMERLQHLEATIDAMLRFLRGAEQDHGVVAVAEILAGLELEFDLLFRQKNVGLKIPQVPPDWFLTGSRVAWVSVLANLLHNALFYSHPASAVLLSVHSSGEGDLILTISDSGPGIAESDRQKVFMPFYTSRRDGTGLGLAITRNFVASMGGTVEIEAAANGGACFVVRLPLWQPPQPLSSGAIMQEKL